MDSIDGADGRKAVAGGLLVVAIADHS